MSYSVRKNWIETLMLMINKPVVLLPFIITAFIEILLLEIVCFSAKRPLSILFAPIIKKFFGEPFIHYPAHLLSLPKVFYFLQVVNYVVFGVLLSAMAVNIFKNIQLGLPVKFNAVLKNALKRYGSFFLFGILTVSMLVLVKRLDMFALAKGFRYIARFKPDLAVKSYPYAVLLVMFLSNIALQVFLVLAVPMMVLRKKPLLKAVASSIVTGFRHFFGIFILLFLPFLLYLPVFIMQGFALNIVVKIGPEANILISSAGIAAALFVECFIVLCASRLVLEKEGIAG